MRVIPRNIVPQVEFFQSHIAVWAEHADGLGLDAARIAAMSAAVDAARAAYEQQQAAQQAAQAATTRLQVALADMNAQGAAIIQLIRVTSTTAGEAVYQLAQIPPPASGAPMGEPGKPTNFKFSVDVRGALELTWACKNPRGSAGTMYQVSRRIGPDGPVEPIGLVGTKRLIDATLPAGSTNITYRIQAVRSTRVGAIAEFNVNFGMTPATHALQIAA